MVISAKSRWVGLGQALGVSHSAREAIWREIAARYGEPHRAYHNLTHLEEMFAVLDDATGEAVPEAVSLAVWFHDIVYDPTSRSNEADSAALAGRLLTDWVNVALLEQVERLILLTKRHETAADDTHGALLLDADLAVLGALRQRYREYAYAIRQEYRHVSDSDYGVGRTAVLTRFLELPVIYKTRPVRHRLEQRARQNLHWELSQL